MSTSRMYHRRAEPIVRRALSHPLTEPAARRALNLYDGHGLRVMRFGVVGVAGVLVNTVVLYLLVRTFGMNHIIAAGIASEVSIIGNFTWNDRWTFADAPAPGTWLGRCMRYNAVALGGMSISLGVLYALTTIAHLEYLIANLVAIATATASNYALNSRFTWGTPPEAAGELIPIPVAAE